MKRAWELLRFAFVTLLLCIIVYWLWLFWAGTALAQQSKKDFWDVATALGTCGAVIVALWVASSANRRKTNDDLRLARLTAAGVTFRLGIAIAGVQIELNAVDSCLKVDINHKDYANIAARLEKHQLCSGKELHAMVALPNYCADNIAGAKDRLHVAQTFLRAEAANISSSYESRQQCLSFVRMALSEAHRMLRIAGDVCENESIAFRDAFSNASKA